MTTFQIIALISFASLGFRAITDKGMIGYFLRKPFDRMKERRESMDEEMIEIIDEHGHDAIPMRMILKSYGIGLVIYLMKPILLCSTCMASVHTIIWFPIFTGEYNIMIIPVMLSVAFTNTVLWLIVEALRKKI